MTPRRAFVLRCKVGGLRAGRGHPALGDTAKMPNINTTRHRPVLLRTTNACGTLLSCVRYVWATSVRLTQRANNSGLQQRRLGSDFSLNSPAVLPQQQNQELFLHVVTERTLTVHANPGVAAGDSNGRTHTHSQRYTKEGGARAATQGGRLAQRWCSICWAVNVATL